MNKLASDAVSHRFEVRGMPLMKLVCCNLMPNAAAKYTYVKWGLSLV